MANSKMHQEIADKTMKDGFAHVDKRVAEKMQADGLVAINPDPNSAQGNKVQVKATQALIDSLASQPVAAQAASKPQFAIVSGVPIPEKKRGGPNVGSRYPFDSLEVGQGFFVPSTEKSPEPHKSLASTVSAAHRRYATKTDQTKTTPKGNVIPVLNYTRRFVASEYSHEGQKGALVQRSA